MEIFILTLLGIFVGFISGFFGIGGGLIIVPAMLFLGYDMKAAIGISIMQMMFTSLFGSFLNYKKKMFQLQDVIFVGLGGIAGAAFSGLIVTIIPVLYLKLFLILSLLISIIRLFYVNIQQAKEECKNKVLLTFLGFVIGAFGTSIGLGGALFLIPILVGFLGFDIKKAVSIGLFFVTFTSVSAFISMSSHGLINYNDGFLLGVSGLIGVYFGTDFAGKANKKLQKTLLLILYIIMLFIIIEKMLQSL